MCEQKAVVILFDNSCFSINSDFDPTRIEAEKHTIELFCNQILDQNRDTQISVGCLAGGEGGIRISFTSNMSKILEAVESVSCGGRVALVKGIRTAILALSYCEIPAKRILVFLHSPHDLTDEAVDAILRENSALAARIKFDFIVFGKTVDRLEPIRRLVEQTESELLEVRECETILSDKAFSSKILADHMSIGAPFEQIARTDPDLCAAMSMSGKDAAAREEKKTKRAAKEKEKEEKTVGKKEPQKRAKRNTRKK